MDTARLLLERGRWSVSAVARALGVSRPHLSAHPKAPAPRSARRSGLADPCLEARIRGVVARRGSYGYRRVTAILNKDQAQPRLNPKRAYRVMRAAGLLLPRFSGGPRRVHEGKVVTPRSDMRWCSDSFEIRCWSGERVHVAFSLDCCDREVLGWVARPAHLVSEDIQDLMAESLERRFGPGCLRVPAPLEWLTDNGPPYTAHATRAFGREAGLTVCTTPAYSPESNGMAEAFVKTLKRDYVDGADLSSAAAVLGQLPAWVADYNGVAPHSALGYLAPREYRARRQEHRQEQQTD